MHLLTSSIDLQARTCWLTLLHAGEHGFTADCLAGSRPDASAFGLRGHRLQVQRLEREVSMLRLAIAQGGQPDVLSSKLPARFFGLTGPDEEIQHRCGGMHDAWADLSACSPPCSL